MSKNVKRGISATVVVLMVGLLGVGIMNARGKVSWGTLQKNDICQINARGKVSWG